MRVLIIHNAYQQPGGEDVVVAQESDLLRREGHDVRVYLRSNHELASLSLVQKLGLIQRVVSAKDSRSEVRGLIREFKPDVVHVHNTFLMVSPSVYEACRDENVPVVQTLHNYRLLCPASTFYRDGGICQECVTHGLLRSVKHECYRDSRVLSAAVAFMLKAHRSRGTWSKGIDAYIAISRFAGDKFVKSGFPASRMFVKPNFVDPDPHEGRGPRDYALFAGRLTREKGVLTLLEAWRRLPAAIPLLVVGDGPLRGELLARAAEAGLNDVHFLGRLPRPEVYEAIKRAAFVVVPSEWEEPFGLIVAEAFACGTPVLGARVGAIPEMLEHAVTGLHFIPGDPDDLAKKVSWAWKNRAELKVMGKSARRVFERKYSAQTNYQLLMEIYASAIDRARRSHKFHAAA